MGVVELVRGTSCAEDDRCLLAELVHCLERFVKGTADETILARSRSLLEAWAPPSRPTG
jgi:hypothetical protein